MDITLRDFREMLHDDLVLRELMAAIETGYATLSALCAHQMGTKKGECAQFDDEDEDEDEEQMDEDIASLSKELMVIVQSKELMDAQNKPDTSAPEAGKDYIMVDGVKQEKDADNAIPIRTLFRMIKQASHPDKIMRFSAVQKKEILECFHTSKLHYEEKDYPALVLCFIHIFLIREEPKRITFWLWKYAKQRHIEILEHTRYLLGKPYIAAIQAYRSGDVKKAMTLFKEYLNNSDMEDDFFDDE